jgi:hypothetical protein
LFMFVLPLINSLVSSASFHSPLLVIFIKRQLRDIFINIALPARLHPLLHVLFFYILPLITITVNIILLYYACRCLPPLSLPTQYP